MRSVHLFWDNSNIFISAQYVAAEKASYMDSKDVRIEFYNLYKIVTAGRPVEKAICVGYVPPELASVWNKLRQAGVKAELLERGKHTGTKQDVDQSLQVHVLRSEIDYRNNPVIVVLLAGDGKRFEDGVGLHTDLRVRLETHAERANRRVRSMTDAA